MIAPLSTRLRVIVWSAAALVVGLGAAPQGQSSSTVTTAKLVLRFPGGDGSVLSGHMRGADQLRNRPALVDAPVGKGRVLIYAMNPIYRWQTFGEHGLVFNGLLFWNDLARPEAPAASTPRPR